MAINTTQWLVFNLAIIGRSPEKFASKQQALEFVARTADTQIPHIKVDDENKIIDYRGHVYL